MPATHHRTSRLILVADDYPEALRATCLLLEHAGYDTIAATTGRQALDLMRQHLPDLVVLDLQMPDINGYKVLDEKNADPALSGIPVIALSGWALVPEPIDGAVPLLKPADPRGFLNLIENLTGE